MASVTLNDAELQALLGDLAGAYHSQVAVAIILPMMRSETPVDTGVLRQQTRVDPIRKVAGGYLIKFRAMPYWGVFVQLGHGVIVPVKAKALRWINKAGTVVFARRVKPVAANPYMYRTFVRAGLRDPKRLS